MTPADPKRGRGPSSLRKAAGKIHLFLGLASGLVVFVVSLTGCLFVFEPQITRWLQRDLTRVDVPAHGRPLPASVLFDKASAAVPGKTLSGFEWSARDRAMLFSHYSDAQDPRGIFYDAEIGSWISVHLDPYTGDVRGVVDERHGLFTVILQIHRNLGLRYEIGHAIVGWAVVAFVAMLLTGLVLWWPRNFNHLKARLKVMWSGGPRRRDYDLHSVGGFYALPFALLLAVTGLTWSFDWWSKGFYQILSGRSDPWANDPETLSRMPHGLPDGSGAIDKAFAEGLRRVRPNGWVFVSLPEDSTGTIGVTWEDPLRSGWSATGYAAFDRYSGRRVHDESFSSQDASKRLGNSVYDIHVGLIWGLPTQILAFLVSAFCASLPVTGFLIWWRKRRKTSARAG